jgi:ABC-2 type transport system ATP-binding protein
VDRIALAVNGVSKTFGKVRAVHALSFVVRRATITGLLGRNGAGKTTTLRMINGMFLPDQGSIQVLGSADPAVVRDRIGYLPEERGLYRGMRVLDHLLFLAELKGRQAAVIRERAAAWLERFELWEQRNARVAELSKGNQQKVQLIGALLHQPQLLVLDEPMSGLDPVNVVLIREVLRELREGGCAILLSTHIMAEAERIADDVILIDRGTAVLAGSVEEVRRSAGDWVRLEFAGPGAFLAELGGVIAARVDGTWAELELAPGTDPQSILRQAVLRLKIRRFEVGGPSLETVFVAATTGSPAVTCAAAAVGAAS